MSKTLGQLKSKSASLTSSSSLPISSSSISSSTNSTNSSFLPNSSINSGNSSNSTNSTNSTGIYLPFISTTSSTINYGVLNEFGFAELQKIPEIATFLIGDIIPDLLDIYSKDGPTEILSMINLYNVAGEKEISNLLFYHKNQKVHADIFEIEKDLIKNIPEVELSEDYVCSNQNCGSRKLRVLRIQMRSADEPATVFTNCTVCRRVEKRSN